MIIIVANIVESCTTHWTPCHLPCYETFCLTVWWFCSDTWNLGTCSVGTTSVLLTIYSPAGAVSCVLKREWAGLIWMSATHSLLSNWHQVFLPVDQSETFYLSPLISSMWCNNIDILPEMPVPSGLNARQMLFGLKGHHADLLSESIGTCWYWFSKQPLAVNTIMNGCTTWPVLRTYMVKHVWYLLKFTAFEIIRELICLLVCRLFCWYIFAVL